MPNIGKIIEKAAPRYTKNGFRLVNKEKKGKFIELIHIESDWGENDIFVWSSFDTFGNLVKKTIKKKSAEKNEIIERFYRKKDKILFTKTNKQIDDKLVETTRESFWVRELGKNLKGMTRVKLHMKMNSDGSRFETQNYEDLAPRILPHRGLRLKTTATRLADGRLTNKTIEGNLKNLEDISKDPYLFIRNYGRKDFVFSAQWIAQEKQNVLGLRGEFFDKRLKDCGGYFQDYSRNVIVDSEQGTKSDVVNTLNHEYRHKWQKSFIGKYLRRFYNIFRNKK